MKNNFEFILNNKLNSILNRDFENANKALKSNLFKSAVILYGGLVEGMLTYLLLIKVNGPDLKEDLKSMGNKKIRSHYERIKGLGFGEIIRLANQAKIINEPADAYLVKHFRNFVHTFKELESGIKINKSKAITARDFTNNIIEALDRGWEDKIEKGGLFFDHPGMRYQEARERPVNRLILENLYRRKRVDLVEVAGSFPGKSLGSALGNMGRRGI